MGGRQDVTVERVMARRAQGMSVAEIAAALRCGDNTVRARFAVAGFPSRPRVVLDRDQVTSLYVEDRMSLTAIDKRVGVTQVTVSTYLRKWGVPIRPILEAQQPHRRPCPQHRSFRAYVFGFAAGDLWINRPNERGRTIVASCNTTHDAQTRLMYELFNSFGPVRTSGRTIRASLDDSFAFLLEKYDSRVPVWIIGPEAEAAFAAGYTDAEGSCGVYDGRARFKISSYDEHILHWFFDWCVGIGVHAKLRRLAMAGDPRRGQAPYPKDLRCLTVNRRLDLLRLIATLNPFLRHEGRIAQLDRARTNVLERLIVRD